MDTTLADLSRTIDPALLGTRIRSARIASGLTQSELAADDVTTAYVSRIEGGQRRPEFQLLERFAGRLGTTLDTLLVGIEPDQRSALRLALDFADLELRSGRPQAAREGALRVVALLDGREVDDLHLEAKLVEALALESLGHLDDAIIRLEDLVARGEHTPFWPRAAMGLTRCYRDSGDLSRSIEVGDRAAQRLEDLGLGGTVEAVQLVVTTSAAYFERGDVRHAVRMCRQASDAAERLDSPKARASAYWNAATFESKQGNAGAAVPLARQALALMEQADEPVAVAMLNSQLGNILLRIDPPDAEGAKVALDLAYTQLLASSASVVDLGHNLVARAKAHYLTGEPERATALATQALELAGEISPVVRVTSLVVLGQVQTSGGDAERGRQTFLEAVLAATAIGADLHAAQVWFELGALLEAAGEHEESRDAYKRAAASTGLVLPLRAATARPAR